jgi:prepilin-type N-terminal cleavage/methylation domain-containing protein
MGQLSGGRHKVRGARAASGFTLIELLVVLLILVALAGIVVPKMSNYIQKAHSGAAAANISSLLSTVENYRANHLFRGYPDKFDSLDDPTSGGVWAGVPAAAQVCLKPLQLDAQMASAMNSAGLNNVMNSNTLVISPSGGGNNATFDVPTSSVALASGAFVMEIDNTAGSQGWAALQLNVPNNDPVNYHYVLLGLGDACTIVGSDIASAPVHFDTIDPAVYYQHYGVVFAVPVTGGQFDSLKTSTQATMATVVGIHDGGLSGLRDHLTEFNQTNQ